MIRLWGPWTHGDCCRPPDHAAAAAFAHAADLVRPKANFTQWQEQASPVTLQALCRRRLACCCHLKPAESHAGGPPSCPLALRSDVSLLPPNAAHNRRQQALKEGGAQSCPVQPQARHPWTHSLTAAGFHRCRTEAWDGVCFSLHMPAGLGRWLPPPPPMLSDAVQDRGKHLCRLCISTGEDPLNSMQHGRMIACRCTKLPADTAPPPRLVDMAGGRPCPAAPRAHARARAACPDPRAPPPEPASLT